MRTAIATLLTMGTALGQSPSVPATFTSAQVVRGAQLFLQHCAVCHGKAMQGKIGPALKGHPFRATWFNASFQFTGKSLYKFVSQQMPLTAPGSLSKTDYLDLVSYILSQNGIPAGARPATRSSLARLELWKAKPRS